jgi:hypothetical protein
MSNRYRVVSSTDVKVFEDTINKLMSEGWVMVGGMSVCADELEGKPTYYQAMVLVSKPIVDPRPIQGPIRIPRMNG